MPERRAVTKKLFQLATMVMADDVPHDYGASPAYLFSETSDNEKSVFTAGEYMVRSGIVSELLLAHDTTGNNNGYPGGPKWKEQLVNGGVPDSKIRLIPFTGELLHTLSESIDLIRLAKKEKWKSLIVVAPPFHQLRAFISVVTALVDVGYPELKVYNVVGSPLSWYEQARHSQGTLTAKRTELIHTELARIGQYQKNGTPVPLLSTKRVLEYLSWRNSK